MPKASVDLADTVFECFECNAKSKAQHTAFVYGAESITYDELYRRALTCANNLKSFGLTAEDCCLISLPNSIDLAIVVLGVWRVGAVLVLLNDQSPVDHLDHAQKKSAARVLVCSSDRMAGLQIDSEVALVSPVELLANNKNGDNAIVESIEPQCESAASVIFTSGSTGMPKGVTQTHRTLITCCHNVATSLKLTDIDRILCPVPWSFDYGFGQLLFTLVLGIPQVLPENASPFELCKSIEATEPTVLAGVPSVFATLVLGVSPIDSTDLSSVRLVTNTGSSIPDAVLKRMFELFCVAEFSFNYGLTETYRSTSLPVELAKEFSRSVGFSIPGVNVVVLRRSDGRMAQPGEVGEIVHSGDGVFEGYWGDESATQAVLKPRPLHDIGQNKVELCVYTGDLGYKDDRGLLYITGRRDRQIKSMGVRVSPAEIEEILLRNTNLAMAVVVPKNHDIFGEMIVAVLVTIPDPLLTHGEIVKQLKADCKVSMSQFMIPRKYLFVESVPRTVNGKVDYSELISGLQLAGLYA